MDALVCDICGGKIIMSAGGLATCDSCGMEYTTERVKEKIQAIKGTVQIDNSNMVNTWLKMANDASSAGNQKEAYDYFTKVLEVEPTNWRAIFERGKAAAWQSTLARSRTAELYQAVKSSLEIIERSNMTDDEKASIKNEFAMAVFDVNNAFLSLRQDNFEKKEDKYYDIHWDEWWEVHYIQAKANIEQTEDVMSLIADLTDKESKDTVIFMKNHICRVLQYICSCQDTYWDSYSQNYLCCFGLNESSKKEFVDKYIELVMERREVEPDYRKSKYLLIDPWSPPERWDSNRFDKLEKYWNEKDKELEKVRERKLAEQRYKAYWAEHSEEKQKLEAESDALGSQLKQLHEKIDPYDSEIKVWKKKRETETPAQEEKKNLEEQIAALNQQKSSLSLFKGKEKKALQVQIDELNSRLPTINESIKNEKNELNNLCDSKIKELEETATPLKNKIDVIEKRIKEINKELTMDR